MIGISKIDLIDQYSKPYEIEIETGEKDKKTGKAKTKKVMYQPMFCNRGEELEIKTENAGSWCIVIAAYNPKNKKLFSMRWEDLIIFEL